MGASNIAAAFTLYGAKVPATSMLCLLYMALVAKDADAEPWYGKGHAALAEHALGRPSPITRKDIKAVERAVQPLIALGAITTDRPAAPRAEGPRTARYRLHLRPGDVPQKSGEERPPKTGRNVPRKTATRPPDSGQSSPENRGTEEYEEPGGANGGDEQPGRRNPGTGGARAGARHGEKSPMSVRECQCGAALDPDGSCFVCRTRPTRRTA